MDYFRYSITWSTGIPEIIVAFLSELPFEAFDEEEHFLNAYLPAKEDIEAVDRQMEFLAKEYGFNWTKEKIPYQNWNEIWESEFHPIIIEDFCGIRADFHPPIPNVQYELVINPKMAFGTGHHETTRMMIRAMRQIDFNNKNVLDFGTGTGVLAILASTSGATKVEAVDIEEPAVENTLENCEKNEVRNVHVHAGDLSVVPAETYDIILANINRNVILESLSTLKGLAGPGTSVIFSGIMTEDEELLRRAVTLEGFSVKETLNEGNWICLLCQH